MRKNLNTFFSGFMFKNEKKCFKEFLKDSQFTVSGFSLGAILAFEYVLANPNKRIDILQLFSKDHPGGRFHCRLTPRLLQQVLKANSAVTKRFGYVAVMHGNFIQAVTIKLSTPTKVILS